MEFAEPNYTVHAAYTPNDPAFADQWGLAKIRCPQAWDITFGLPSVVVAIVDSGIDLEHPDFVGKLTPGWDFANNDADPDDDYGHGTHCAGTAGATTDNGIGVAGVGFNCRLMPVKVLDKNGSGTVAELVQGIYFAVNNGAKVISLSLVSSSGSQSLQNAVDYAWNHGVVICCAAGNSGSTTVRYPAGYTNSIAVASTTSSDERSSFSNYGPWVDVAAPGSSIYSTVAPNGYSWKSGTSMAAPHVAGLAALLWSHYGADRSATFIRQRIEDRCDPVGAFVSYGRINAEAAVSGPAQETFAPSGVYSVVGGILYGGLGSLTFSDDFRLALRSVRSGPSRALSLTSDFQTGQRKPLSGLRFTFEGSCTFPATMAAYAWDFDAGAWVALGSARHGSADSTISFFAPGTGDSLQSPSGLVRFMLRITSPGRGSIVLSTDFVELTKSLAP